MKSADEAVNGKNSSWSITVRLSLLYALASFGMLLMASGFLYWVMKSNLETEDTQFIAEKIHVLQTILREQSVEGTEIEMEWEGGRSSICARILDERGRVLVQSSDMGGIVPASLSFPVPYQIGQEPQKGTKWKARDGRSYLLMAMWAEAGHATGKMRLVQVALDVSRDDSLIYKYRRKLGVVLLVGMLFSIAAGIAIARRGMRPLSEITKVVKKITATQLQTRIVSSRWPKELTSLAAAFDEMFDRLEDSFFRLSQFSANLAHELRTPVNNLRGEAEVALSRTRTPDEYRQVMESSLEEYIRLSRMIDNLLFLARAEGGETGSDRELFEVSREIDALLDSFEALAEEQGIDVTVEGNAQIAGYPPLFRRALSNLLANAFQYTPPGGKVAIRVKKMADRSVEISVRDTGIGIEPEHLPKIFDRFYRTGRARAEYFQGSGLGLSIVKSIMGLHNSEVIIKSDPDKGTTVTLKFPRPDLTSETRILQF